MKNVKQLTTEQSIKLMDRVYKLEIDLKERISMLKNKEKSIKSLITRMLEIEEDLRYETKLNVELSSKLETLKINKL
jgi:ribosomal protein S13